jgi:acetyl esterase/lipase
MKLRWGLAALLALATASAAAPQPRHPPRLRIAATSVRKDTFPQAPVRFAGGIEAFGHVEYANYVGYRPLLLDLYLHADRTRARVRPLVVWIHGGGWNRGDSRQSGAFEDWPGVLARLGRRGYVVASVDYRLTGEAKFPAQVQDVNAAVRFLRSRARDFGIDAGRVYLWGGSAGGHLAALAAVSCGVPAFDPPPSTGRLPGSQARTARPLAQSDCVQGAALWYGVFDLATHAHEPGTALAPDHLTALLGCDPSKCPDLARKASPITYASREAPPLLLIAGTADEEVAYHQSEAMTAAVKAASGSAELLLIPGSGHGFIARTAEATRHDSLEALDRTFRFFDTLARR